MLCLDPRRRDGCADVRKSRDLELAGYRSGPDLSPNRNNGSGLGVGLRAMHFPGARPRPGVNVVSIIPRQHELTKAIPRL